MLKPYLWILKKNIQNAWPSPSVFCGKKNPERSLKWTWPWAKNFKIQKFQKFRQTYRSEGSIKQALKIIKYKKNQANKIMIIIGVWIVLDKDPRTAHFISAFTSLWSGLISRVWWADPTGQIGSRTDWFRDPFPEHYHQQSNRRY